MPTTTDDWPFFYLRGPAIPMVYCLMAGVILALFVRACWEWKIPARVFHWDRSGWHFFFLGAAFMLLEVQNISKAAVVLGSTWTVNAVIVSGVLCMILVANALAARFPALPAGPVYGILLGIVLFLYGLDLASLAFLPYVTKAILVGGLTTLPMAFSGIIFIRSFAAAPKKDQALGANLFGSLIGGLLQTVTFVVGIKALLLIVAALYAMSWLTLPVTATPKALEAPPARS